MKKYLTIFLFFIAPALLSSTHNFYIGASLTGCLVSGKRNDSVTDTRPAEKTFADNKTANNRGAYGGVLAGYILRIKNFGISPEFFYNYGKLKSTTNNNFIDNAGPAYTIFDITYKIANQAGAHLRLGYFLEDYFLYTLLGMNYQNFNFEAKAQQADRGVIGAYNYKSKTKNINALVFGFGAQKRITENYAIGLEYKFARFPTKNFTFSLNDQGGTELTSSFKYKLNSVALKIMYMF
ncbi:MAG: hypothetical protein KBD04_02760 [Proteobacteria bacterium]|nr:hypothetical protein [Pseudomonadota bacterium]